MCGITGIVSKDDRGHVDAGPLRSMMEALFHRGPDDSGEYVEGPCALGFRRLAILDLEGSRQPLFNEDRSIVLVCNGEIFNFKELRKELQTREHRFTTDGDIETILHLYEENRDDAAFSHFLNRLHGQFSFALYDRTHQRLLLARDQVGIAPLFYVEHAEKILFASEIKALLRHPDVSRSVDLKGLDQIITFPGMVSPQTMFEGVSSLKPGHYLLMEGGVLEERCYWDLEYPQEDEGDLFKSEEEVCEALHECLSMSVLTRLHADVPVGYYLSGGLDSSLMASLIHALKPGGSRKAFSIVFQDTDIDESKYQQEMVRILHPEHYEIPFQWEDIQSRLEMAVRAAESPLKETYNTCSLALSEAVHNQGMKVVLSGEGADELFAGYVGYRFDHDLRDAAMTEFSARDALEGELRQRLWGDSSFTYERHLYDMQELKQALYAEQLYDSLETFDATRCSPIDVRMLAGRNRLHQRSYIDFKLRIADHLLADHGDRVAMANSVEVRYPFLDIRLIELVKRIPTSLLVHNGIEKYILKRYARQHVAASIVEREKFSFVAPGSSYLLRQHREWIRDLLSYETIRRQGYFNPDAVQRLLSMYEEEGFSLNQTFDNDLLMIVLTFGIFVNQFELPDC